MSLFGEDNAPWSLPEPKSNQDASSVLAGAPIPHSYTEAFEETSPIGGFTTLAALHTTLEKCGVTEQQKHRVLAATRPGNSISRELWNVIMALVAMAQRDEPELDLEAVDNLRAHLPDLWISRNHDDDHVHNPLEDSSVVRQEDDEAVEAPDNPGWQAPTAAKDYNPISKDTINITILPEKEGMFMFRHVVYIIEGTMEEAGSKRFKVTRRYSDFLWLLECLVKIYPFRLLPVLPPKRLAVDGRYLSNDAYFLERRRRGLTRFVNQLVKHPLLKREKLVQLFLTVDTELSQWRKQASYQIQEEFTNRIINPQFVQAWDTDAQMKKWRTVRQGTEDAIEILSQMVLLMDRVCKRQEAMANDMKKLSVSFASLRAPLSNIYADSDDGEMPAIRQGLGSLGRYAGNGSELYRDESNSLDIGTLEDVKQMRELVAGIREMFYRHDKLGGNNIGQLQQRIELNERKLTGLSQRHDSKPNELDKLANMIARDKQFIKDQTNRDWLIKECMMEELELCQRTQFQMSKLVKEWTTDLVKYSELLQTNWAELGTDIQTQLP